MIDKELLIKKSTDQIKENKKVSKIVKSKIEEFETTFKASKENSDEIDEEEMIHTMHMAVSIDVENSIYKDLIKRIKKGEFNK